MTQSIRRLDPGALIGGLVLIGVGAAFLLNDFGDLMRLWRVWWPMTLVVIGVAHLFRREVAIRVGGPRRVGGQKHIQSGIWLIALGCWLQAVRLHLFNMTFTNSWPLILIFVGAGVVLRAVFDVAEPKEGHREQP